MNGNISLAWITVSPNKDPLLVSLLRNNDMNQIIELLTYTVWLKFNLNLNVFIRFKQPFTWNISNGT